MSTTARTRQTSRTSRSTYNHKAMVLRLDPRHESYVGVGYRFSNGREFLNKRTKYT